MQEDAEYNTNNSAASGRKTLLSPGEPAPHEVINANGSNRMLLVCEHASNRVPASLNNLGLSESSLERHIGWDVNAVSVARHLSDYFDSRLIIANYSRLVADLNRSINDKNCFRERSETLAIPGNLNMTVEERNRRIDEIFRPFHAAVEHQINRFTVRQVSPVLISIHSFTPVYKTEIRDVEIGILWDKSSRLALPLMDELRKNRHLVVGDNLPYSGVHPEDYTIDVHGEAANLACLGIEIRQDLIANEAGVAHYGNLIARALEPVLLDDRLYHPQQDSINDQAAV